MFVNSKVYFNNTFLYIKRNKSRFPWIFMEQTNCYRWFPMISGQRTQKFLSVGFEILGLVKETQSQWNEWPTIFLICLNKRLTWFRSYIMCLLMTFSIENFEDCKNNCVSFNIILTQPNSTGPIKINHKW